MARRASAFASDLADLDTLDSLPLPTAPSRGEAPDAQPQPPANTSPPARRRSAAAKGALEQTEPPTSGLAEPPTVAKALRTGTRATQVRLPPHLAAWLGEEANQTKKTLSTVVALAAREHRGVLSVAREDADGLDISRRVASGTVPVTLRLTGAQRQLLDEIAVDYRVTRSAIVVAALAAASTHRSR